MGCLRLTYQEKTERSNFLTVWRKSAGSENWNNYYPFGLTFNSYSRENSVPNRWKFQGQEHIDDLDLGWDSFKWRNHQPDIGRFFNVDPLAEKYYYNSPYAFSENKVVVHRELEGLEAEYLFRKEGQKIERAVNDFLYGVEKSVNGTADKIGNAIGSGINKISDLLEGGIITYGDGQSSPTNDLRKGNGKAEGVDMEFIEMLDVATGNKKLEGSKAAKNRTGKTGGTDIGDVVKGITEDGDLNAIETAIDKSKLKSTTQDNKNGVTYYIDQYEDGKIDTFHRVDNKKAAEEFNRNRKKEQDDRNK